MERILQTMTKQQIPFPAPPHPIVYIIPLGVNPKDFCFDLLCKLRHEEVPAEMDLSGKKVQQSIQLASSMNAEFCLIIGDEEMESQKAKLKKIYPAEKRLKSRL